MNIRKCPRCGNVLHIEFLETAVFDVKEIRDEGTIELVRGSKFVTGSCVERFYCVSCGANWRTARDLIENASNQVEE